MGNSRVLEWVFGRCAGTVDAKKTAIGDTPKADDIDFNGLEEEVTAEDMRELRSVDAAGWKIEMESIKELYSRFGAKLSLELTNQLSALKKRLNKNPRQE